MLKYSKFGGVSMSQDVREMLYQIRSLKNKIQRIQKKCPHEWVKQGDLKKWAGDGTLNKVVCGIREKCQKCQLTRKKHF